MNHLEGQKSPYLMQHAGNPVDWYPWGDEAFREARRADKPIFLSIGYSTCHWCHVMERESFADPEVALLMNDTFVSIKVDREERPDLDQHYMTVSQMLTGTGGWPLTIVMTPEGKPFFAGTYLPRDAVDGRMGMLQLIPRIHDLWKTRRAEIAQSADSIATGLVSIDQQPGSGFVAAEDALRRGVQSLARIFDPRHGGFGSAPKFPMPALMALLLRAWRRDRDPKTLGMVEQTLSAMRNGGIFDQVGFGFHRYSTDERWLVPHFEKMLYDQALLSLAYTEAWQATGRAFYRETSREILEYVLRDLALPGGGFASAEDADSEGEEGRFYLWTAAEIRSVLGDGPFAGFSARCRVEQGILHRDPSEDSRPGQAEALLLQVRGKRVRPLRDDKILADWNGLMIAALARAGSAFDGPALTQAAETAAGFVWKELRTPEGRLLHRFRDGEAAIPGFADDYAFLAWGLLELFEATSRSWHLDHVIELVGILLRHFWDQEAGGFYLTADDAETTVARRKSFHDGVLPSANSVGFMVLLKLGMITGNPDYGQRAREMLRQYPPDAGSEPVSCSFFLSAVDLAVGPSYEVTVTGDPEAEDTRGMLRALHQRFIPNAVLLLSPGAGPATAVVCRDSACNLPTNDLGAVLRQLDSD